MKKVCTKCKLEFPLSDFYKQKNGPQGRTSECKKCRRIRSSLYAAGHLEQRAENSRKHSENLLKRRKLFKDLARQLNLSTIKEEGFEEYKRKCEDNIKKQCRLYLNTAIANGYIVKPNSCEECGQFHHMIHGHHFDYSKPLNVMWLCPTCHFALH